METKENEQKDPLPLKTLLVLFSWHHKNTEKIARVFAEVLDAPIKTPQDVNPKELEEYDLVGFGSGIDSGNHYKPLLDLADKLPVVNNKKAFIFSTCGAPVVVFGDEGLKSQTLKNHSLLRKKLQDKGYLIIDEFGCAGFNTNSFLKFFGGLNKGRPNAQDLKHAREFARDVKEKAMRLTRTV
jgi:flavodoxin